MSGIPGTNVAAMIVPFDTADIFATHADKYGRGGFRVCDTVVERDGITTLRRRAGMWVRVLSDGKVYELGSGLTNADWTEVVFSGGSGGSTTIIINQVGTTHTEVLAGGFEVVESLLLTNYMAAKWMVTVTDMSSGLVRSSEVTAHHDMAGNVTFIEAAIVGDVIPMSVDVVLSASNMNLVITSTSLNTLIVDTVRINSNGGSSQMTYALAGTATVLENLSAEKYRSFKWFVTVSDGVDDKVKSIDIMAHQDTIGGIKYSTYGLFGDSLSLCALQVVPSSGNIQLVMNNTSTNNVTVNVMRIAVLLKS